MSEHLFDSHAKTGLDLKPFLIAAAALVLLVSAAAAVVWYTRPVGPAPDDVLAAQIRDRTVMMLEHPTFSGVEFRKQILGNGGLWKYVKVNDEALFWYPESDDSDYEQFVAKNFYDPSKIELAHLDGSQWNVGDYKIPASSAKYFLRTTLGNFHIDPDQTLTFPYSTVTYTLSLKEMNSFMDDSVLYGGRLVASLPERSTRPRTVFANHGIMVARPDEPTLTRLTGELLKDQPAEREARIQRLTDFVSSEIAYNFIEGSGQRETLKRPDETLMTRNGDCSNKTILLASLLEQIGEEYIILYYPHHITVAVPQGNFPADNALDFNWADKNGLSPKRRSRAFRSASPGSATSWM
jgi:hypothetical protein